MVFRRVELGGIGGLLGTVGLPWRLPVSGVYFLEFLPNFQKFSSFQKIFVISEFSKFLNFYKIYYSGWKNLHEFLWHAYQSMFDMYVIS